MKNISENFPGYNTIKPMLDVINTCEATLEKDPENIDAHIGIADSYFALWCYGTIPYAEAIKEVKTAESIVLNLNDSLSDVHTLTALIKWSEWNWDGAEKEFNIAIDLDSNSAKANHWYALYHAAMGQFEESISLSKKAVQLEPTSGYKIGLGSMYYFAQDFETLKKEMKDVISEDPDFAQAYDWLGMAYILLEEFDNSIEVYEKSAALSGRLAEILGGLGHAYGIAGRKNEAKKILDEMLDYTLKYHIPPIQIAFVYAGLGDDDKVFGMLERAYKERSWELIFMREEPWFDYLREDNRFKEFVSRLKFPKK
jgi:tetratricopeptide (TPR) repeat protein